jgi:predicted nucleic acid-binding protein
MAAQDKARGHPGRVFCGVPSERVGIESPPSQIPATENKFVSFLLDTNAVSEWVKPRPNPGLIDWMESADEDRIFISVISLAELRYGVERLAAGSRRNRLEQWLSDELPLRFEGRILPVDNHVADTWGKTVSRSEAVGRPMGAMDAFLAATAETYRLTLVTRNVSHFPLLKAVLNPWADAPPPV